MNLINLYPFSLFTFSWCAEKADPPVGATIAIDRAMMYEFWSPRKSERMWMSKSRSLEGTYPCTISPCFPDQVCQHKPTAFQIYFIPGVPSWSVGQLFTSTGNLIICHRSSSERTLSESQHGLGSNSTALLGPHAQWEGARLPGNRQANL